MINNNNYNTMADFPSYYLGNYRLLRLLGHGGFASVYLGEHQYLKRLAAIKVLRTVLAEQEKMHFLEEAKLLANLSHPHIIRVLEFEIAQKQTPVRDSIVVENIPFLVMDYIAGGNLRTVYPAGTRLFLDTIIDYITQAAAALQYAHNQRIIHRDIKPENLLLNERQEIMLSDFGLALFAPQPGLLSNQNTAGTLPYTAPEQLRGKPGFASDQYSLGIVAYEWLCGYPPFRGSDVEVIMQHVSSPPPPLRSKNLLIPQNVENVVMRALAKEPQQRYDTIQAFAQALQDSYRQRSYTLAEQSPTVAIPQNESNALPFFYYLSQTPELVSVSEKPTAYTVHRTIPYPENRVQRTSSAQRNRQRMIQKVRTFWIDCVLEPSLHNGPLITPLLQDKLDAVAGLRPIVQYHLENYVQNAQPDLSIMDAYDQANGALLILGEAGSGKTTLLLQLTDQLLKRAEHDETMPIPVVFLLSSWPEKQRPLDQWLSEELYSKYQVPRILADQWLRSEMILPLLDGLDEVKPNIRSACITAINAYKQQHGLSPLVVCSRLTEYLLFPPRVLLQRAIAVQSLTLQQVDEYFQSAGSKFDGIYKILRGDPLLYGLITTPLMLNIITLAYRDKSSTDLLALPSSKERYRKILDTYVEQMLRRPDATSFLAPQDLTQKLSYLARKMQEQNLVVFYIEQMQPTWIEKKSWLQLYMWLAVLLPGALIGALTGILTNILLFHAGSIGSIYIDAIYGIVIGFIFSKKYADVSLLEAPSPMQSNPPPSSHKGERLKMAFFVCLITFLFLGLARGWAAGLVNGLILGILSIPTYHFLRKNENTKLPIMNLHDKSTKAFRSFFPLEHFKNALPIGVACGLTSIITLIVNHAVPQNGLLFLVTLGIRDSLRNTLIGILLSLLLVNNNGIINSAEIVSWSWGKFWRGLKNRRIFNDILIGLIIGVLFGSKQLFQGNLNNIVNTGLSTGTLITVSICLISAVLQGVSSNKISNHHRTIPNEGIKRSLNHGIAGSVIGAIIAVFFSAITSVLVLVLNYGFSTFKHAQELQASLHIGLVNSLLLAPAGALLIGLLLGLLPALQHLILRLILRMDSVLPLKLTHFLDYSTDCVLMRRTGGGYIFIHRVLLEYFASLHAQEPEPEEQMPSKPEPLVRLL